MARLPLSVCCVIALVFTLTGCTVPSRGLLAIGKNAAGDYIGVVQLCGGHVDGMTVYRSESEHPSRRFRFPSPVTSRASLALDGLPSMMRPGEKFDAYAWSTDSSSSAFGPEVTIGDLEALTPGQVFGLDWSRRDPKPEAMPLATFVSGVSEHCQDFG